MSVFNPPAFEFSVQQVGTYRVLCIVDQYDDAHPTTTVTNGVEEVLVRILRDLKELPELIIYRDSYGEWDRIKVAEGRFQNFAPIVPGKSERITDATDALQLLIANLADASEAHQ